MGIGGILNVFDWQTVLTIVTVMQVYSIWGELLPVFLLYVYEMDSSLLAVYLFVGLMMMYLLLRTFHKMADLHGLTTFLQLPRCEETDQDDDREPIVETRHEEEAPPQLAAKSASEPLEPGSQPSYNSISKGWATGQRSKHRRSSTSCGSLCNKPSDATTRLVGWTSKPLFFFI